MDAILHSEFVEGLDENRFGANLYSKSFSWAERPSLTTVIAHARNNGTRADDFTSFLAAQAQWGEDRADRPDILHTWKKDKDARSLLKNQNLGMLYTDTVDVNDPRHLVIVDDHDLQPLRDLDVLPIQISSTEAGWLFEAWSRLDHRIKRKDLCQRMRYVPRGKKELLKFTKSQGERQATFRNKARLLSWSDNAPGTRETEWDKKVREEMEKQPNWIAQNTTRHLTDLNLTEMHAIDQQIKNTQRFLANGKRGPRSKNAPPPDIKTYDSDYKEKEEEDTGPPKKRGRPRNDITMGRPPKIARRDPLQDLPQPADEEEDDDVNVRPEYNINTAIRNAQLRLATEAAGRLQQMGIARQEGVDPAVLLALAENPPLFPQPPPLAPAPPAAQAAPPAPPTLPVAAPAVAVMDPDPGSEEEGQVGTPPAAVDLPAWPRSPEPIRLLGVVEWARMDEMDEVIGDLGYI